MTVLNLGKRRGLQMISSSFGSVEILALDHRASFKRLVQQAGVTPTFAAVAEEKLRIVRHLGSLSSAMLFDPSYGAAPAVASGALEDIPGLVIALDHSGYGGSDLGRTSQVIPNWSVAKAKQLGAAAVKLMVYHHPRSVALAEQEELVARIAQECQATDITFILEPLTHPVDPDTDVKSADYARARSEAIIETVSRLDGLGADLLKVEFPGNLRHQDPEELAQNCRALDKATDLPWIVLSGGTDFGTCQQQIEIACRNGASGYAIGRTIWQDGVVLPGAAERDQFLQTTAASRMEILSSLARRLSTPWWTKTNVSVDLAEYEHWVENYTVPSGQPAAV